MKVINFETIEKIFSDTEYGISSYRDVIIVWDRDQDDRVLQFIDELTLFELKGVIAVQEYKGTLNILWDNSQNFHYVSKKYQEYTPPSGDMWYVTNFILSDTGEPVDTKEVEHDYVRILREETPTQETL